MSIMRVGESSCPQSHIIPVVVVFEWASGDCSIVAGYTEDISASSAQWLPGSNDELAFVGYSNNPLKLGFVYCFNRW